MILASHILVGGAIGIMFHNPAAAVPVALASHYILDMVPHREYNIARLENAMGTSGFFTDLAAVVADLALGFALLLALLPSPFALVTGFLAALPDAITFLSFLAPRNTFLKNQRTFHRRAHLFSKEHVPWWLALLTQGGTIALCAVVIASAPR